MARYPELRRGIPGAIAVNACLHEIARSARMIAMGMGDQAARDPGEPIVQAFLDLPDRHPGLYQESADLVKIARTAAMMDRDVHSSPLEAEPLPS